MSTLARSYLRCSTLLMGHLGSAPPPPARPCVSTHPPRPQTQPGRVAADVSLLSSGSVSMLNKRRRAMWVMFTLPGAPTFFRVIARPANLSSLPRGPLLNRKDQLGSVYISG